MDLEGTCSSGRSYAPERRSAPASSSRPPGRPLDGNQPGNSPHRREASKRVRSELGQDHCFIEGPAEALTGRKMVRLASSLTLLLSIWLSSGLQGEIQLQVASDNQHNSSSQAINKLTAAESNQQIRTASSEERFRRRSKSAAVLPSFASPIGNVSAVVGRDVRLVCTVDNLGSYQVAWLKEESNTIISIDTNIIITNYRIFLIPDEEERKWVLHIKDVQESDRGFYQCQVNTSPTRSTSGYLEVVVPPAIVKSQSSQVVETTEHSNVNLQCKAAGHPKPTVTWRRDDGAPIKLAGSRPKELARDVGAASGEQTPIISQLNEVKSDKLTLFDVDRSMAGIYVCLASNGIPSDASRRIPLYVKFEPKVSVQTKLLSVAVGEPLELECLIEGYPKPSSFWSLQSRQAGRPRQSAQQLPRDFSSRWYPTSAAVGSPPESSPSSAFERLNEPKLSGSEPASSDNGSAGLGPASLEQQESYQQSELSSMSVFSANNHPHNNRIQFRRELASQPLGAPLPALQAANASNSESKVHEGVSVRQTAVNPYTYRLQLSIARLRPEDFGRYTCLASNQMGSSEAHLLVARTNERARPSQLAAELAGPLDEPEYQRDSLASPEGQANLRRPQSNNANRVIYDENYLQAIKSRQNGLLPGGSRSQQRLKSKSKNSGSKLRPHLSAVLSAALLTLVGLKLLNPNPIF